MTLAPFDSPAASGRRRQKKTSIPKGPVTGTLGQKSENFCGATQIGGLETARSAACGHTPFLGNGGKARRSLLRRKKHCRPLSAWRRKVRLVPFLSPRKDPQLCKAPWGNRFCPPSAVHSTGLFLPPFHHRRLSLRTKAPFTRPRHRFAPLNLHIKYACRGGFVKP